MSQPFARYLHPFHVAKRPELEPEVKRAIVASWASDKLAIRNKPALRRPPGGKRVVPIEDVLETLRAIDNDQ